MCQVGNLFFNFQFFSVFFFPPPPPPKKRGGWRICGHPSGHSFGRPLDRKQIFIQGWPYFTHFGVTMGRDLWSIVWQCWELKNLIFHQYFLNMDTSLHNQQTLLKFCLCVLQNSGTRFDVCGRGCDRPVRPLRNEPKGGPGCYLYGAGHVTWLPGNRCTQYVGLVLCV